MSSQNISTVYDELNRRGFTNLGDLETFGSAMKEDKTRKRIFKAMGRSGGNFTGINNEDQFKDFLLGRDFFSESIANIKGGGIGVLENIGRSAETVRELMGNDPSEGFPRKITEFAIEQQDKFLPTHTEGFGKAFGQGLRSVTTSVGTLAAGGAAGALAGMVAGPPGMVAGAKLGAKVAVPVGFGLSEYDRFMDDVEAFAISEGTSIQEAEDLRSDTHLRSLALQSATIEGAFEALSTMIGLKLFGLLKKGTTVKSGAASLALTKAKILGFAKKYATSLVTESSTEFIQEVGETALRNKAGVDTRLTPLEAGVEVIPSSLVAASLFTMGGQALQNIRTTVAPKIVEEKKAPVLKPGDLVSNGRQLRNFEVVSIDQYGLVEIKDLETGKIDHVSAIKLEKMKQKDMFVGLKTFKERMLALPNVDKKQLNAGIAIWETIVKNAGYLGLDQYMRMNVTVGRIGEVAENVTGLRQATITSKPNNTFRILLDPESDWTLTKELSDRFLGVVDLVSGEVSQTVSYNTAKSGDFNPESFIDSNLVEKESNNEVAFFWLSEGKIVNNEENIPDNIKQRILEQIQLIPEDEIQTESNDPNWHSNVSRDALTKYNWGKKFRTDPKSLRNWLYKQSSGNERESKYMGLDEFLEGKNSVTYDEVSQFLAENNLLIKEVILGAGTTLADKTRLNKINREMEGLVVRLSEIRNKLAKSFDEKWSGATGRTLSPDWHRADTTVLRKYMENLDSREALYTEALEAGVLDKVASDILARTTAEGRRRRPRRRRVEGLLTVLPDKEGLLREFNFIKSGDIDSRTTGYDTYVSRRLDIFKEWVGLLDEDQTRDLIVKVRQLLFQKVLDVNEEDVTTSREITELDDIRNKITSRDRPIKFDEPYQFVKGPKEGSFELILYLPEIDLPAPIEVHFGKEYAINQVGWVRATIRRGPNNEKILFVDEVQSDVGRDARGIVLSKKERGELDKLKEKIKLIVTKQRENEVLEQFQERTVKRAIAGVFEDAFAALTTVAVPEGFDELSLAEHGRESINIEEAPYLRIVVDDISELVNSGEGPLPDSFLEESFVKKALGKVKRLAKSLLKNEVAKEKIAKWYKEFGIDIPKDGLVGLQEWRKEDNYKIAEHMGDLSPQQVEKMRDKENKYFYRLVRGYITDGNVDAIGTPKELSAMWNLSDIMGDVEKALEVGGAKSVSENTTSKWNLASLVEGLLESDWFKLHEETRIKNNDDYTKAQDNIQDQSRKLAFVRNSLIHSLVEKETGKSIEEFQQDIDNLENDLMTEENRIKDKFGDISPHPQYPWPGRWQEVLMKRMIKYAAEHQFDKLAWVSGKLNHEQSGMGLKDAISIYDKMIPNAMRKLAKKFGTSMKKVFINLGDEKDKKIKKDIKTIEDIRKNPENSSDINRSKKKDLEKVEKDLEVLALLTAKAEAATGVISYTNLTAEQKVTFTALAKDYGFLDRDHALTPKFDDLKNFIVTTYDSLKSTDPLPPNIEVYTPSQTDKLDEIARDYNYDQNLQNETSYIHTRTKFLFTETAYLMTLSSTYYDNLIENLKKSRDDNSVNSVEVTPEMKDTQSKFQTNAGSVLGSATLLENGKTLIEMFEGSNVSTIMHEMWHVFENNMTGKELAAYEEIYGSDKIERGGTGEKAARDFETYLAEGIAPNQKLKNLFNKFKRWLTDIYKGILADNPSNLKLSKEKRAFFDSLLADDVLDTGGRLQKGEISQENIQLARTLADEAERASAENPAGRLKAFYDFTVKLGNLVGYWSRVGARDLGVAIKNFAGIQEVSITEARVAYKQIAQILEHNKDDLSFLVLAREDPSLLDNLSSDQRSRIKPALKIYSDLLDKSLSELRGIGVLREGFIEGRINATIKLMEKAQRAKNFELVKQLEQDIEEISKINYSPVLLSWFDSYSKKDPLRARKVLRYTTAIKRKTFKIQDLINEGIISKSDISLAEVMLNYGTRVGRDKALANIRAQAINTGQAIFVGKKVSEERKRKLISRSFTDSPNRAVIFKNYMVKPPLSKTLEELTEYGSKTNMFAKFMAWAKLLQFINPIFLPTYDLVQHSMRFGFNPIKAAKYMKDGWRHVRHNTKDYQDSVAAGKNSKPMVSPYESVDAMVRDMESSNIGKRLLGLFKTEKFNVFKNWGGASNLLQGIYTLSWRSAWYMDDVIRMGSYLRLKKEGLSTVEAAEQSASFHGDYASVPAKTRQFLNNIFFTPTFKIVMGGLYLRMIRGSIYSLGGAATKEQKNYAMGLVYTTAGLLAFDILMRGLGWEPVDKYRSYKRNITTEDGEEEMIWSFSSPMNMFSKYYYKAKHAFSGEELNPAKKLAFSLKWDLHPVWRLGMDILDNRKPDGSEIYSGFDDRITQHVKSLWYYSQGIVLMIPALGTLVGLEGNFRQDPKVRKAFEAEHGLDKLPQQAGWVLDVITKMFSFRYVRGTPEERAYYKILRLKKTLRRQLAEGTVTEKQILRFQKSIKNILAEM